MGHFLSVQLCVENNISAVLGRKRFDPSRKRLRMKKQETVNQNFQKVRQQWSESQQRKLANITLQQQKIVNKIQRLEKQYNDLQSQKLLISQQEGPKPPTEEQRASQKRNSIQSTSIFG